MESELRKHAIVYVDGKTSPPIRPEANGTTELVKSLDVENLPASVYDEIELVDVLEYDDRPNILDLVVSKLRHQGILKISGTEALQVTRILVNGDIGLEDASNKLLGGRHHLTSVHHLKEKLQSMNLEIMLVAVAAFRYMVEAKRP